MQRVVLLALGARRALLLPKILIKFLVVRLRVVHPLLLLDHLLARVRIGRILVGGAVEDLPQHPSPRVVCAPHRHLRDFPRLLEAHTLLGFVETAVRGGGGGGSRRTGTSGRSCMHHRKGPRWRMRSPQRPARRRAPRGAAGPPAASRRERDEQRALGERTEAQSRLSTCSPSLVARGAWWAYMVRRWWRYGRGVVDVRKRTGARYGARRPGLSRQ